MSDPLIHRRLLLLALGTLPLTLAGCSGAGLGGALAPALAPITPTMTVGSVAVQTITLNRADILVGVDVTNPNPVALPLTGLTADFELAGVRIGQGTLPQSVALPAGGTVRVPVNVTANPLQLGTQAPFLLQQSSLPYRISGTANVGGLRIPIPVERTGVLRLR